jgi:predicted nucleotidyltransferase
MLERLFTSKTRVKIITLFVLNPDREIHIREIMRLVQENVNAVRRELTNLEETGLLKSSRKGNMKQYILNKEMPLYEELASMVLKTEGVAKILKEHLNELGSIQTAFIYGSFASNHAQLSSDIDVFIIGNIKEKTLISTFHDLEKQLSREINYILLTPEEFSARKRKKDPFVINVIKEPKVMLQGDLP